MRRTLRLLAPLAVTIAAVTSIPDPVTAADPYRIGMTAAMTGGPAQTYIPMVEVFKAYIAKVNAEGGVNGHPIQVLYEDDRGEPARAAPQSTTARAGRDLVRIIRTADHAQAGALASAGVASCRRSGPPQRANAPLEHASVAADHLRFDLVDVEKALHFVVEAFEVLLLKHVQVQIANPFQTNRLGDTE